MPDLSHLNMDVPLPHRLLHFFDSTREARAILRGLSACLEARDSLCRARDRPGQADPDGMRHVVDPRRIFI